MNDWSDEETDIRTRPTAATSTRSRNGTGTGCKSGLMLFAGNNLVEPVAGAVTVRVARRAGRRGRQGGFEPPRSAGRIWGVRTNGADGAHLRRSASGAVRRDCDSKRSALRIASVGGVQPHEFVVAPARKLSTSRARTLPQTQRHRARRPSSLTTVQDPKRWFSIGV
jgi:hypothetical protein